MKKSFDQFGKPKSDQLHTLTDLRSLINIQMENDEGQIFLEEEIVNNIIHCFQTRLKVDEIIAKLPKTSQQVAKLGMIA